MIRVGYANSFLRRFRKLDSAFQKEIRMRIEEFRSPRNHQKLAVHKLKGTMTGTFAFSVNYRDRVIFEWSRDKKIAYLLDIGDHSIYE